MILKILSSFLGSGVAEITGSIRDMKRDALAAKNTSERIELDEKVARLEARRDVLVAESKSNYNAAFRIFLALPFGLYAWKLVVWDKILGMGATDNLSPQLWQLMMLVFAFYFMTDIASLFKRK